MSKGIFAAAVFSLLGAGRAADSLVVFKAGDTAKASAVNANFQLLWERMSTLAAANRQLAGKVDSLHKAKATAPVVDSLEAEIAGMRTQIRILNGRVDSAGARVGGLAARGEATADSVAGLAAALAGKAGVSHVHPASQVTGLLDSLKARVGSAQGGPLKVCTGKTAPGIGWVDYNAYADYIDVNTSVCGFTSVPQYFTSLGASTLHYITTGATSIYSPTATGFRIYVGYAPWADKLENPPEAWGMHVNWVAIGP